MSLARVGNKLRATLALTQPVSAMTFDPNGNLWLTCSEGSYFADDVDAAKRDDAIVEFAAPLRDGEQPTRIIRGRSKLHALHGISYNAMTQTIFVGVGASIQQFSALASGRVTPLRTISGGKALLGDRVSTIRSDDRTIYVVPENSDFDLLEFPLDGSGNIAPPKRFHEPRQPPPRDTLDYNPYRLLDVDFTTSGDIYELFGGHNDGIDYANVDMFSHGTSIVGKRLFDIDMLAYNRRHYYPTYWYSPGWTIRANGKHGFWTTLGPLLLEYDSRARSRESLALLSMIKTPVVDAELGSIAVYSRAIATSPYPK
jgi:hypothetical protein